MFARRFLLSLILAALAVLTAQPSCAQIPGLTSPAAPAASAAPADPLKRDTPRSTILGFIRAAGEERYNVAIQYFQPAAGHRRVSPEDDQELAEQLFAILSLKYTGTFDGVSNDPNGRLDDGLAPDQEIVGGFAGFGDDFPITLVRLEDDQGRKLWYISRKTLDQVPHVYDSLEYPQIEKYIPKFLVEHRLLAMPLWQWLAILLLIPVSWFIARIVTVAGHAALRKWHKVSGGMIPMSRGFFTLDPVTLALAIFVHYAFVIYIGTSILYRLYYRPIILILLGVAFYWLFTGITSLLSQRIARSLLSRGLDSERSIIPMVRRFIEVVIFITIALLVLRGLGVNVTAALAGVGIGTLAIGLGAQKTFENVFGGVSILFDKVIRIGDVCKINNQSGTVEDIGLRSTRLRTPERTILSIPNGIMATSTIENLRFRDKYLCQQIVRLRYDLSPGHLRYVLDQMREILSKNQKVEETSARVRFIRFSDYALEVEIYCYILEPDFATYLATQESLFLELMDSLEQSGAVVALPSQTTLVTKDSWVDAEKAKSIQATLAKSPKPTDHGADSDR
jgi:MscS family membrane protein